MRPACRWLELVGAGVSYPHGERGGKPRVPNCGDQLCLLNVAGLWKGTKPVKSYTLDMLGR